MAINPETLAAQRLLVNSRFGELPSFAELKSPLEMQKLIYEITQTKGRDLERDGKKIKQADLFSYDPEEHIRYVWKATNKDLTLDRGTLIHSFGNLSVGMILEGFSLTEIATDSAKGLVPYRLKSIELPGSIDRGGLIRVAAEHSVASLDTTADQLRRAHEIGPRLFELAETNGLIYLQQIELYARQLK